jgi:hypothetical protein
MIDASTSSLHLHIAPPPKRARRRQRLSQFGNCRYAKSWSSSGSESPRNMADDKDPREEALWEYANEKVRPRTAAAAEESLLRWRVPREAVSPPAAHSRRSAPPMSAPPRLRRGCHAAARHAAAHDGGPLPGTAHQPSRGELTQPWPISVAPPRATHQGCSCATARFPARRADCMAARTVHSTSSNTSAVPALMVPSGWTL